MDIDHDKARWIAERYADAHEPIQLGILSRAYLDVAPEQDEGLIDEDPLPDGYDVDEVPGKPGKFYISQEQWAQLTLLHKGRRAAIREAWRLHHGF